MKTNQLDIDYIYEVLKLYNVNLYFTQMNAGGYADIDKRRIFINYKELSNLKYFLGTLFHELAHIICSDECLYNNYHNKEPKTLIEIKKFRRIALKAERFVDKKADKLMKQYYPIIPYDYRYKTNEDKKWYYKNFLNKNYSLDKYKKT